MTLRNDTDRTPTPTRVMVGILIFEGIRIVFGKAMEVAGSAIEEVRGINGPINEALTDGFLIVLKLG